MPIMDIFKKKQSSINDDDNVATSSKIKIDKNEINYEPQINDLHGKGVPLSQAILKLSKLDGFSTSSVLKTFSVDHKPFEDGLVHFFTDDSVLFQKGTKLLSNRKIKTFAQKESIIGLVDKVEKPIVEEDRMELSEELFLDLETLEKEIIVEENNEMSNDEDILVLENPEEVADLDINELVEEVSIETPKEELKENIAQNNIEVLEEKNSIDNVEKKPTDKTSKKFSMKTEPLKEVDYSEKEVNKVKKSAPARKSRSSSFSLKK